MRSKYTKKSQETVLPVAPSDTNYQNQQFWLLTFLDCRVKYSRVSNHSEWYLILMEEEEEKKSRWKVSKHTSQQ